MVQNKPDICPICHEANYCAVEDTVNCWCMTAKIPQGLFEQLPEELEGTQCICQKCIENYIRQNTIIQI